MSNSSKSDRKENRIRQLEKELSEQKKKTIELQKQKTIRLDDDQVEGFLDDLTQRIEWSTNRIVDESPKTIVQSNKNIPQDGFSFIIKLVIASFFFVTTVAIGCLLYNVWNDFWSNGWINRIALFVVAISGFDCLFLCIEILREKDRNYIISLFSALVALVALIVTLVK
ncbi:MAG: hypothetical protein JTJ16_02305 [Ruminococcaceae bacterium]|nr:hypothetical protein [Oscillospiraceae bacterium]